MQRAVNLIKKISPPIIVDLFKTYLWRYGWHGNYKSWQDARKASTGYDSDVILRKVKTTLLEVKNNPDLSERDSVKFNKKVSSWPLLSALMWIAAQNDGKLNVIDFGGSLGSTYFHNKFFFDSLKDVRWNIVEQDNFVKCGKSYFETDIVKFYSDLGVCAEKTNAKIIIFSSVLQYLEKPYELLNIAINNNFEYVLIDRTPFIKKH